MIAGIASLWKGLGAYLNSEAGAGLPWEAVACCVSPSSFLLGHNPGNCIIAFPFLLHTFTVAESLRTTDLA